LVIKLKTNKLTPKDIGQLDFYLAAVDGELKREGDAPTIGLQLCKERNRVAAEIGSQKQNITYWDSRI
jgi:hypothetical protein